MSKQIGLLWLILSIGGLTAYAQMRDPTRPNTHFSSSSAAVFNHTDKDKKVNRSDFGVSAIWSSKTHRSAVINGRTVEIGGKIGSAQLIRIARDYVVLKDVNGEFELHLYPTVRQPIEKKDEDNGTNQTSD